MFTFTSDEQGLIKAHVEREETKLKVQRPDLLDENGHLTVCQLFENDALYFLVSDSTMRKMPVDLVDIDFGFLNRKFN